MEAVDVVGSVLIVTASMANGPVQTIALAQTCVKLYRGCRLLHGSSLFHRPPSISDHAALCLLCTPEVQQLRFSLSGQSCKSSDNYLSWMR